MASDQSFYEAFRQAQISREIRSAVSATEVTTQLIHNQMINTQQLLHNNYTTAGQLWPNQEVERVVD